MSSATTTQRVIRVAGTLIALAAAGLVLHAAMRAYSALKPIVSENPAGRPSAPDSPRPVGESGQNAPQAPGHALKDGKAHGYFAPAPPEQYARADVRRWQAAGIDLEHSPVDLRFLNHRPAGAKGRVRAEGSQLVYGDGDPARFWGTNVAAHSLFDSKERIEQHARRIAALGYNLVRLHHHDSMSWVQPCVIELGRDDSQHIDAEQLDKIHYWVNCLKEEGVYTWLDLHVGRILKPADASGAHGNIEGIQEILGDGGRLKGYCYFDAAVRTLMDNFNKAYLGRINPYTGMALAEDPAVAAVLLTNENDLTHHFGNMFLPDKNRPIYNRIFEDKLDALCRELNLPRNQAWCTWEPGPSKIALNELEHRFFTRQAAVLRALGLESLIVMGHMWGNNSVVCLPALAAGGLIDVHSYGREEALTRNPRYEGNFISYAAAAQVEGKPMAISEWNVPYPARDRFTAPLYVASIAALQGWDAPMLYNYAQSSLGPPSNPKTWDTFADPPFVAITPAAALAFRRGDVAQAAEHYCYAPSPKDFYASLPSGANARAFHSLAEQHRLTVAIPDSPHLAWDGQLAPPAGTIFIDPERDFLPAGAEFVASDTGELRRYWDPGLQTIDTPRTQAAHGWIGGMHIALGDTRFAIETPKAAAVFTSLDGKPLASSRRILLTLAARALEGPPGQSMPLRSEPIEGTVWLRTHQALEQRPLAADGSEGPATPLDMDNEGLRIDLPTPAGMHWYLLTPTAHSKPDSTAGS